MDGTGCLLMSDFFRLRPGVDDAYRRKNYGDRPFDSRVVHYLYGQLSTTLILMLVDA